VVDFLALLGREIASTGLVIAPMPDWPRPWVKLGRVYSIRSCGQNQQNHQGNICGFDRPSHDVTVVRRYVTPNKNKVPHPLVGCIGNAKNDAVVEGSSIVDR
jgi:hypothetical protein